ncbi:MAG: 2-hydroxy-acid oxidase [Alphaproteobacteria bacterium]|nr:2-hydroxy-acid oxidase [Alphaproteobacteria bacterium]
MHSQRPTSEAELSDMIASTREPFCLGGGGSKAGFGHRLDGLKRLDLAGFDGVKLYEPHELILTVGTATPLRTIRALLADSHQNLPFEPPDWRWLLQGGSKSQWQSEPDPATIGGVIATNLSGSARLKAGAARDNLLGFHGVNGLGEIIHGGGRVVKNVTGYDLPKLIAGSFGTLVAMTEVTVKAMPAPEAEASLILAGMTAGEGMAAAARALNSPHEIHAAAYLPAEAARLAGLPLSPDESGFLVLRLVGSRPSMAPRLAAVTALLSPAVVAAQLEDAASLALWQAIGNGSLLPEIASDSQQQAIWRVSVAPQSAASLMARLEAEFSRLGLRLDYYYDWAGGLILVSVLGSPESMARMAEQAVMLRAHLAEVGGGHATLLRAPHEIAEIFEPLVPSLAALTARIKASFDPKQLLNPGIITPRIRP